MATLPMYLEPDSPLGWRYVCAPGGYEECSVKVIDAACQNVVMVTIGTGSPRNRNYRRRYREYRRRPTVVAPPLPPEYPYALVLAMEGPQMRINARREMAGGSLRIESGRIDLGSCSIVQTANGVRAASTDAGVEVVLEFPSGAEPATMTRAAARRGEHWKVARRAVRGRAAFTIGGKRTEYVGFGDWAVSFGTSPWEDLVSRVW